MELLEIVDIAERLGLPVSTVRFYRDRFILYLPMVRIGRHLRYPPEALEMIQAIDEAARTGATMDEIEQALQWRYPVTVITSQPIASAPEQAQEQDRVPNTLETLVAQQAALQEHIGALSNALADLASTPHIHSMRAEMASLAAALAQRDAAQRHALRALAGQLRQDMDEMRRLLTRISGLLEDRSGQPAPVHPHGAPYPSVAEPQAETVTPNGRLPRTPRRMGHPYRAGGTGPLQP